MGLFTPPLNKLHRKEKEQRPRCEFFWVPIYPQSAHERG